MINEEKLGHSVFIKTFGDSPTNKILDFLIVFDKFDYSMMDIAEKANVGYSTLKLILPKLIKQKIVVKTRISGKSPMYKINKENMICKRFIEFYWDITNKIIEEQLTKKVLA